VIAPHIGTFYDTAVSDPNHSDEHVDTALRSFVLSSPADALLREAIATTLRAEPEERNDLFDELLSEIAKFMAAHPQERPWTYTVFTGTDGSRIFRGGVGHSLVIDRAGTMWRARSYEDFDTEYAITETECRITALTPRYEGMRRCSLDRP
jgi:hypothetical protein